MSENHRELVGRARELSRPLLPVPTGLEPRLGRCAGVRAVLFDVYGTLLISGAGDPSTGAIDQAAAIRAAMEVTGFEPADEFVAEEARRLRQELIEEDHRRSRDAGCEQPEVDIREIWAELIERLRDQKRLRGPGAEVVERFAIEYECRVNPVWPMPGAAAALEELREAGLVLGIVSNSQFYTPIVMEAVFGKAPAAMGLRPEYCGWSYLEKEAKPGRALYRPVVARLERDLGIKPTEILYVGNDMLNDVWAAKELGLGAVLCATDQRTLMLRMEDERVSEVEPDCVMTGWSGSGKIVDGM